MPKRLKVWRALLLHWPLARSSPITQSLWTELARWWLNELAIECRKIKKLADLRKRYKAKTVSRPISSCPALSRSMKTAGILLDGVVETNSIRLTPAIVVPST